MVELYIMLFMSLNKLHLTLFITSEFSHSFILFIVKTNLKFNNNYWFLYLWKSYFVLRYWSVAVIRWCCKTWQLVSGPLFLVNLWSQSLVYYTDFVCDLWSSTVDTSQINPCAETHLLSVLVFVVCVGKSNTSLPLTALDLFCLHWSIHTAFSSHLPHFPVGQWIMPHPSFPTQAQAGCIFQESSSWH